MDTNRLSVYLQALEEENKGILGELEKEAIQGYVPIIKKETQSFLRTILQIHSPQNILEIGTAIGFSAVYMGTYTGKETQITTIENYAKRIPIARNNIQRAEMENKITLIEGDAKDVIEGLEETYDFIFLDGAKGQYIYYLPVLLRLLREGGILLTDNVLQEGDILESRYGIKRRDRTIHGRMREYLYAIKHHKSLTTSILPLGDGVALSIKNEEK